MGNVGTIIRTMVGFDFYDLAIIRPGVDIFDPRVIRSSMGSLFDINYEYFSSFGEYEARFPSNSVYPFLLKSNKNLGDFKFQEPASLVFGNEGSGLDNSFQKYENSVRIPSKDNIDSLNLAVAVGISLYSFQNDTIP
jgi:TrmH family RNA methyltransferase